MAPTLRDVVRERELDAWGYTKIRLIDPAVASSLLEMCMDIHPESTGVWQSDFNHPDPEVKRTIDRAIGEALRPGVEREFVAHQTMVHRFMLNWPGPAGGLPLHQDPTFVDPATHRSVLIWTALTPAHEGNGTLHVVPRSHLVQDRPHPQQAPSWAAPHGPVLRERHLRSVALSPGEAIVFDCRLLHCSFPNPSDAPRVTAAALALPQGTEPWFLEATGGAELDVYRLDPEFFIERYQAFGHYSRPEGLVHLGRIPWEPIVVDADELADLVPAGDCPHPDPSGEGTLH